MRKLDISEGLDVRRMETRFMRARKNASYKETGLQRVLDVLSWGTHLIFQGPKGAGKTINIEEWAFRNNVPFLRESCSGATKERQLLGGFVFQGLDETYYNLGVLPTAIDVANECGMCVCVLEEINTLDELVQKAVNSVADYRREVTLANIGVIMRLNEATRSPVEGVIKEIEQYDDEDNQVQVVIKEPGNDHYHEIVVPRRTLSPYLKVGGPIHPKQEIASASKLWIVGTMNPDYGGTYDLNEDFRSRFDIIDVHFMDELTELDILKGKFPNSLSRIELQFVKGLQTLAKETRGGKYGYALSTRDLEQCILAYLRWSADGSRQPQAMALKMLEAKFPTRYISDFQGRVRSTFKSPAVDLTQVKLY